MARISIALGLGAGLALALSCKDDGEVSMEEAPRAFADKACAIYYGCHCEDHLPDPFSSEEDCRLEVAERVQAGIDEGEAEGLTYDGECFADYIGFVEDLGCATGVDVLLDLDKLVAFDTVGRCKWYSGTRAAGQSCDDLQDGNGDDCQPDLRCEQGTCVAPERTTPAGDPCEEQRECVAGTVCIDVEGGDDELCETLPTEGETCKGTADLCATDTYCDQGSKTCRALPPVGSECAPAPNVVLLSCALYGECDDSTCVEAPTGGQSCTALCQPGFACDDGVCVEQTPAACVLAVLG
jgi:hypothetical protein